MVQTVIARPPSLPKPKIIRVNNVFTGPILTLSRFLGSTSTFALVTAKSDANLRLVDDVISILNPLPTDATQVAIVRETLNSMAFEYPVTVMDGHVVPPVGEPGSDTGVYLSTVGLNDRALTTGPNGQRYVDAGTMSLPDGDWTIHIATMVSNDAPGDGASPILSLGDVSDNIATDAGNLQIGYFAPNGGIASDPFRGMITASGYSDNYGALQKDTRTSNLRYSGQNSIFPVAMLAGPRDGSRGDNRNRAIFLSRRGKTIELWVVDPGCTPLLHDSYADSNFGAITNKRVLLGAINRADKGYGAVAWHLRLQRFFKVNSALTPDQMVAVSQGVDPRQVINFNAATDRLVAFTGTDAQQTDMVGGQTINLMGSDWNTTDPIIPTSVTADMPRGRVYGYGQVIQRTGATTSDVLIDGTVTGSSGDIYGRLINWSSGEPVTDWQNIATSFKGNWFGKFTGVPSNVLQWCEVQLRKGTTGDVFNLRRQIGIGILIDLQGQSIAEYLSSSGLRSDGSSPIDPYMSFYSIGKGTGGSEQRRKVKGWNRTGYNGWGETLLAQKIGELTNCPVAVITGAVAGSSAGSWSGRLDPSETSTPAFATDTLMRPGYIWWQQGHGSTGDSSDMHKSDLTVIESKRRAALTNNYRLLLTPLINCSIDDLSNTRRYQQEWLTAAAAADKRIVPTAAMCDIELKDGVHETDNVLGGGRIVERIAASVARSEGVLDYDPVGPVIVSAKQITPTTTQLTIRHSGGTQLLTPKVGSITGFEISTNENMSDLLAVSDAKIINPTTIEITHADAGNNRIYVFYQRLRPGTNGDLVDGMMTAVSNAVYDNKFTNVNTTLGLPLHFMINAMQAATIAGGVGEPEPPVEEVKRALVIGDENGGGSLNANRSVDHVIDGNLLDAQVWVELDSYASVNGYMQIVGNFSPDDGFDRAWQMALNTQGQLVFAFSDRNANYQQAVCGTDVRTLNPGADGIRFRVVANPTAENNRTVTDLLVNGSPYRIPNNQVSFFTSFDGENWTLIESQFINVNGGIRYLDTAASVSIGTNDANEGRNTPVKGSFYYVLVRDGNGRIVSEFDFTKRAAFAPQTANNEFNYTAGATLSSETITDDNGVGVYNIYGRAAIK